MMTKNGTKYSVPRLSHLSHQVCKWDKTTPSPFRERCFVPTFVPDGTRDRIKNLSCPRNLPAMTLDISNRMPRNGIDNLLHRVYLAVMDLNEHLELIRKIKTPKRAENSRIQGRKGGRPKGSKNKRREKEEGNK